MKELSDRLNAGAALTDEDKNLLKQELKSFKETF